MRQKVLQIITLSQWGGAQQVVFDLAVHLNKEYFQVEVACQGAGLLVEKLRKENIKVYEIPFLQREMSFVNDLKTFFYLKKLIKKEKYDIVHCHSAKAGILGRWAAKAAGVKKIYYTVHSWSFYNQEEFGKKAKLFIFLEKFFALWAKKIICVAQKVMEDGIAYRIAPKEKFLVIANGIDFKVENKREQIRSDYGIKSSEVVLGMVARLAYPKDPLLFLQTAREVLNKVSNAKFILVGDGPLMGQCQAFVQEQKLQEKILLLGEKMPAQTRALFFAFDVFVLLSHFEGMPITILEAMFAKLPVIASDVGGIKELVEKEKGGFLLERNQKELCEEKMLYLIQNAQTRKQMGEYNFQKAQNQFSLEKMIKNYESLYLS